MDNLASLQTLDEKSLLDAIQKRFEKDIIYTYIGDILLAVNPYKDLPIYNEREKELYRHTRIRTDLPPHLYAVAHSAFENSGRTLNNQCILVSGESGAGKTEATKILMGQVVNLSATAKSSLVDRIIMVNPLLEAFGNAQTVMNANSSRFGKFIEIFFNNDGEIQGGYISEYLLEKSRIVSHTRDERNFHIFYYMFAGLEPDSLQINLLERNPEQHRILKQEDNLPIYPHEANFRYNEQMWKQLRNTMDVIGFSKEDVDGITAILASILHITDIVFEVDHDLDCVFIQKEENLDMASELLGITPEDFASALISNETYLRGEKIVTFKNIDQANDGRDAIAKALYHRLFGWIVRQINQLLSDKIKYATNRLTTIGILDIAGFENFENNNFEQICINTANEQLQFYFNQHIFQWEIDEYKKDGVKGKDIKYIDNSPILNLLMEEPIGLLSLIDEESRFPKSSDSSLIEKLNKNFGKKPQYTKAKGNTLSFTLNHYAGPVIYSVNNFLEKNRDKLSSNLMSCMSSSESGFIVDLFTAPLSKTGSLCLNPNEPKRTRKSVLLCKAKDYSYLKGKSISKTEGLRLKEAMAENRKSEPHYENCSPTTLAGNFKVSLAELMKKLLNGEPHFVRCIKPNNQQLSDSFKFNIVLNQLKYTGVLETIRIRRLGFSSRIPHAVFVERFASIAFPISTKVQPTSQNITKILNFCQMKDWALGKTKVFLKYWHLEKLNTYKDTAMDKIIKAQCYARGYLARKQFRDMKLLSSQDAAALRAFSIYVSGQMDFKHSSLTQQQEHDVQKYQDRMNAKKMEEKRNSNNFMRRNVLSGIEGSREQNRSKSPSYRDSIDSFNDIYNDAKNYLGDTEYPPIDYGNHTNRTPSPTYDLPVDNYRQYSGNNRVSSGKDERFTNVIHSAPPVTKKPIEHPKNPPPKIQSKPRLSDINSEPTPVTPSPGKKKGYVATPFMLATQELKSTQNPRLAIPKHLKSKDISSNKENGYPSVTSSNESLLLMTRPEAGSSNFLEYVLEECVTKIGSVNFNPEIWGKIYYIEKGAILGKIYIKEKEVIIDGSSQNYTGLVIGLGAFDNAERDSATKKIRTQIGQGMKLSIDGDGNVYASKQGKCDVILKGYNNTNKYCVSKEAVESLGRIRSQKMKVWDFLDFKGRLAEAIQEPMINVANLQNLALTNFAFSRNTFDDLETPCWICLVNFNALRMLGSEEIFDELISLAQLRLSSAESAQIKRNWLGVHCSQMISSYPSSDVLTVEEENNNTSGRKWAKKNLRS